MNGEENCANALPGEEEFDLASAIAALVRGDLHQLDSCLVLYGEPTQVENTKSNFRCHFIRSDGNNLPRVKALADQLALEAVFHCVPRSDISALRLLNPDDQLRESSRLSKDAARLFTSSQPNSGEGGELLLYALLEQGLGVPQILSKMSLKTNTNVQIHGTDGVHAKLLDSGNLALYWGEAKIWSNLSAALADCFHSIAPFILGESVEQDTWLIRHYADLGDSNLTNKLLEFFDNKNPASGNVEIRGACLIGFNYEEYPALPQCADEVRAILDAAVVGWQRRVSEKLIQSKIDTFEIEVFFLPIPSANDFRSAILAAVR